MRNLLTIGLRILILILALINLIRILLHIGLIDSLNLIVSLLVVLLLLYMTLIGTNGACAACKYQRRRCAVDCPLAPYFPADQPKKFQDVHRLFGVRSIVKILENLDEAQKPEAMKSIIFQSQIRERSPVHGCLGVTQQLHYMVWQLEEELKVVNSQLQFYRSQNKVNATPFFTPFFPNSVSDKNNPLPTTPMYTDASVRWGHDRFPNEFMNQNEMSNNNGITAIQSQLGNLQMVPNREEIEDEVPDDFHQFLIQNMDERESFPISKEPYTSSFLVSDETRDSELKRFDSR